MKVQGRGEGEGSLCTVLVSGGEVLNKRKREK